MSIRVETRGVEEHQHPFYVIRYAVVRDGEEYITSVARYVHNAQGGKVQFLEPDMRKIQKLPNAIEHMNEVERVIKEEAVQLMEQLKSND